jgi:sugar lactone lactonase YvrE
MLTTFPELDEVVRIPSPAPAPQALACDGEHLWLGSWETARIYGIDAHQGRVIEEAQAPGKPVGATVLGDELRFICSEHDDSRYIRRYVPGHGFKSHEAVPCPDDAGSFLAFDGTKLWLSQRHRKRVHMLDASHRSLRTVDVGEEILGIAWVGDRLYLSTWLGEDRGGCRIAYIDPHVEEPALVFAAEARFVALSLARDGDRLWTNDAQACEIVSFTIPQ